MMRMVVVMIVASVLVVIMMVMPVMMSMIFMMIVMVIMMVCHFLFRFTFCLIPSNNSRFALMFRYILLEKSYRYLENSILFRQPVQ